MLRRLSWTLAAGLVAAAMSLQAASPDETKIRALLDDFAAAFRAKDLDKIMSFYKPGADLVAFDVVPPRQYVGADAYRKDFKEILDSMEGPVTVEILEASVTADHNMAYSRSVERVASKLKDGNMDVTVRVTDVYRKINGKWLIVHEHVSVPVDLATGKADLQSKP